MVGHFGPTYLRTTDLSCLELSPINGPIALPLRHESGPRMYLGDRQTVFAVAQVVMFVVALVVGDAGM